jgi:pyruvate/2-oxoglutarate dehydrogenase complex dihydrolipoamide dehydrogenase (E3) component
MIELDYDTIVIGAGPAGLASAIKAKELGLKTVLVENKDILGGIPLQCIHPGFGLQYFKEDLTGTEFIYRLFDKMEKIGVEYLLKAHVYSVELVAHNEKVVNVITPKGIMRLRSKTIVYTVGAREKSIFEINIIGDRPGAGIYTAGEAQTLMDLYGILPGKEIVIVGSGDVGLIMARRFALEGAKVKSVIELMPYPGGTMRNIVQCLQDYSIPLYLSHKAIRIIGNERVEKVVVAKVDENLKPIEKCKFEIPCDTVILAAGLVPNVSILEKIGIIMDPCTGGPMVNELLETNVPGIFVAGNALVVNDLVDYVVEQGEQAAEGAFYFVQNNGLPTINWKRVVRGRNIRLIVPHYISGERDIILYARVQKPEKNVLVTIPEIAWKMKLSNVRPAEMIRAKLSKTTLESARFEDKVTVEVNTP